MKTSKPAHKYSIAEARNDLARIVHEAETGTPAELSRRGEPVAVILSIQDYLRFQKDASGFWNALEEFRQRTGPRSRGTPKDLEGLRDRTTGRDIDI